MNIITFLRFYNFLLSFQDRLDRRVTQKKYGDELTEIFEKKFDLDFKIPIVFVDSHYNKSVPSELETFKVCET